MTTRVEPLARGVWGVVATPFTDAGEIDEASLGRLVQFYESVGAAGLTVLGVFGEAAALTAAERMQVLGVVAANSRLPIVAGVTSLSTAPAIAEIENAQAASGDRLRAVMVQANSGSADRVIEHLRRINDATGAAIVLQDYPKSSGVTISTDNLVAVVEASPFVSAVKAEAPPTAAAIARITARVDVSVFGGLGGQGLLDELAAGSAGAMTGFSYPEALVGCVSAWLAGDEDAARAELLPYLPLINFEQQPGIALALRKELFRRRGLFATGIVRAPAASFPAELDAIATDHLAQLDGSEVR
ncbi:dihydrodipicolinate synthase family protein [Paramicrobacterium agarici]|uniref:4-hydroxy-tetrahydrodipicolinate synthase n=1 Tax=Paramicrobacterium agarici TaxID=630514 RepID=A0A2A9DTR6_9MICO|nr:dihydrodipicolinate synthase family protein [Microbacterium agarici]PFG29984.1 4-hydroxy-tetrahydrodipicolinate synthase [Microbacterium agarici]